MASCAARRADGGRAVQQLCHQVRQIRLESPPHQGVLVALQHVAARMHAPIFIPSLWLPCGRLVSRTCAQACSEASRQPQRLIANHAQPNRSGGDPSPTTLGSNQVFTPSLHESGSGSDQVATKVYNQQQQQQQRRAGAAVNGADRRQYSVPVGGQQRGAGQQVPGLQNADQPMDGFMC